MSAAGDLLAACTQPTGGGSLPTTGLGLVLPVLGLLLIGATLLLVRRRRALPAALAVLALALGVAVVALPSPPARAECNDTGGGATPVTPTTYLVGAAVESIN